MTVVRSIALFALAAVAEIGGAWLVWQGVREHRGLLWVGAGVIALGMYGFVATLQSDPHFGRILAAYGGVFVAGSLAWGMIFDGFRPDRLDIIGAAICLVGVAVIMYAPRAIMNTLEQNKQTVRELVDEVMNGRNLERHRPAVRPAPRTGRPSLGRAVPGVVQRRPHAHRPAGRRGRHCRRPVLLLRHAHRTVARSPAHRPPVHRRR